MVVGLVIYQFEVNQSASGEIEPRFSKIGVEKSDKYEERDMDSIIITEEKFRIFFNHTTGLSTHTKGRTFSNIMLGNLKSSRYKYISYYHKTELEKQFITIALFEPAQEITLFEEIFTGLTERLKNTFEQITDEVIKKAALLNKFNRILKNELRFALFQIERLENLTKMQKVALIYATFERQKCLQILREGPISKEILIAKMRKIRQDINIDIILKPFIELNLVRRDWASGKKDKKTGRIEGQGEYLFLVKDIALVRQPPQELYDNLKTNRLIGDKYVKTVKKFYSTYNPFNDILGESELLANFLLNPDIFDLMSLLRTRSYPLAKIPSVISEFNEMSNILAKLIDAKIVAKIKDVTGNFWISMIGEITPVVIFPEYLIPKIADRASYKEGSFDEESLFSPISTEVATLALDLLENTYNDQLNFQEVE